MNFEITSIINQSDLKINLLTYESISVAEIDSSIFSKAELIKYNSFGATKRKREFYFSRVLWQSFGIKEEITYSQTGKPLLQNGHISISHSSNAIAISFSNKNNTGLDIEHYNPKIKRIKNKFLSKQELKRHDWEDEVTITTLWSIKEAVYKLCNIPGLSFKDAIEITKIGEDNTVNVKINQQLLKLNFHRIIYPKFVLTYCTENPTIKGFCN